MQRTTRATVVFLEDKDGRICLARKKQPIHHDDGEITTSLGTWNGYGGKEEGGDQDILDTAIRELEQESSIVAHKEDLIPCGHVYFFWPTNVTTTADMEVFFYVLRVWQGDPEEGEEMGPPEFFHKEYIPYDAMMQGDRILLPKMFQGIAGTYQVFFGKKDDKGLPLCVEV
jgi:8-oxo-dGTP pyrophosphatase MutT (NUDIX family)